MSDAELIILETLRLLELTRSLNPQEFTDLLANKDKAEGFHRFAKCVEALAIPPEKQTG